MKKGFTLIEVVVAVGLLAMVIAFSSLIFKVSIETRRTAGANAEIMQKLRAITNQLNRDFAGLRPDAPLMIWFDQDTSLADPNRYDQIMFFADGDFQSTQLYLKTAPKVPSLTGTDIVVGNVARIYYGQAALWQASNSTWLFPWEQWGDTEREKILNKRARTLARRTHILTADSDLKPFPTVSGSSITGFTPTGNDSNEHDSISLSQWKTITNDPVNNPLNNNKIIETCFSNAGRPQIDFVSQPPIGPIGLHMLMTEGVESFAVQLGYWGSTLNVPVLCWFPSNDPNGNLSAPSDFSSTGMGTNYFGSYFNLQQQPTIPEWHSINDIESNHVQKIFLKTDAGLPKALKFTFRIYDSKGIIKSGRTFTHIVYLGN